MQSVEAGVTDGGSLSGGNFAGGAVETDVISSKRNGDFTGGSVEAGVTDDGILRWGGLACVVVEAGVTDDGSLRSGDFAGGAVEAGVADDGSCEVQVPKRSTVSSVSDLRPWWASTSRNLDGQESSV